MKEILEKENPLVSVARELASLLHIFGFIANYPALVGLSPTE